MNRKEAIELLPIIQAYAEGKEIEIFDKTMKMWKTAMLPHFGCDPKNYRIKPVVKCRPFKGRRVLAGNAKAPAVWVGED